MANKDPLPSSDDIISQHNKDSLSSSPKRKNVYIQLYVKGRSGTAQNHQRFADYISQNIGELGDKLEIVPKTPDESRRVHEDIFLLQACARVRDRRSHHISDDDIQNLRAELLKCSFFQGDNTTPLFLSLAEEHQVGHLVGKVLTANLLQAFRTLQGNYISTGESSPWDAIGETAYTVAFATVASYCLVRGAQMANPRDQRSSQPGESSSASSSPKPSPILTPVKAVQETRRDTLDYVTEVMNTFNAIHGAFSPARESSQPESISQGASKLRDVLPTFESSFNRANSAIQAQLLTSDNTQLSIEEAIDFIKLIRDLSQEAENTTVAINKFAPLFDKKYSQAKTKTCTVAAVTGLAVAAIVTVLFFNPAGWGVYLMGKTTVDFVAGYATAAPVTSLAGAVVGVVCGCQASINSDKVNLMEQVRTSHSNFIEDKKRIILFLILRLHGGRPQHIPKEAFSKMVEMGIQPDVLDVEEYNQALFKTAWESLSNSYKVYLESVTKLLNSIG